MLKIEDLKVSDELVCIDLKSMEKAWENASDLWRKAKIDVLKISHINVEGGLVYFQDGKFYLERHELKYFKKKEQSQYTFDDLIDVAVQAYKDGILSGLSLDNVNNTGVRRLSFRGDGISDLVGDQGNDYKEMIDTINSLYKETFVIESEKDVERLNNGAKTTLKNGEIIYFQNIDDGSYWFTFSDYDCEKFPFIVLKGATVEQDRNV